MHMHPSSAQMEMALPPYSLRLVVLAVVMVVLFGPMIPPSSSSSSATAAAAVEPQPRCHLAYTSMALLQCRETPPQAPTPPCCDTLLYSIDEWPEGPDQGVCCLCMYVVVESNMTALDLATTYVSCRGKDSRAVLQWMATITTASPPDNCYDPCGIEAPPSPPPPPRPSEKKKQQQKQHLGVGMIDMIALGAVFGVAATGWCIYYHFFSPAAKARRSPNPSGRGTAGGDDDGDGGRRHSGGGGVQMPRLSSSRRSSSGIL